MLDGRKVWKDALGLGATLFLTALYFAVETVILFLTPLDVPKLGLIPGCLVIVSSVGTAVALLISAFKVRKLSGASTLYPYRSPFGDKTSGVGRLFGVDFERQYATVMGEEQAYRLRRRICIYVAAVIAIDIINVATLFFNPVFPAASHLTPKVDYSFAWSTASAASIGFLGMISRLWKEFALLKHSGVSNDE